MLEFVEFIVKCIVRFLFAFALFWTGEIILSLITLGRRKPRWDIYSKESSFRFALFSEMSFWIGTVFWLLTIAGLWYFIRL